MKERPILFSAPMVRALLDGSKTQTRRVVKQKHLPWLENSVLNFLDGKWNQRPLPYGKPGDRLWVREAWGYRSGQSSPGRGLGQATIEYRADGTRATHHLPPEGIPDGLPKQRPCRTDEDYGTYYGVYLTKYWRQWRPSIFMPRWASRITLEITAVRVERLNDISERDAWAEGCEGFDDDVTGGKSGYGEYAELWKSINGPNSWDLNPWVWVIEFKKVTP